MQESENQSGVICDGHAFGQPRNFLKNNRFVYAVISQRARGLSIGVNLTPNRQCNFDCIYCEVDRSLPVRDQMVDVPALSVELSAMLTRVAENKIGELPGFGRLPAELLALKEVALSGEGEPTLCPQFRVVVNEIVRMRAHSPTPFFKIVIITNTAGLPLPEVRDALGSLNKRDEIWVKLDAGTQEYMDAINRPNLTLNKTMANIMTIALERPVVIQSLFPLLRGREPAPEEIEQYVNRLQELKAGGAQISLVQIYSAHRPPHLPDCGHLSLKSLSNIARRVRTVTGLKAEVF